MAEKSYVVTGALATPYHQDGSRVYLYQGAVFPSGLREGEVERFLGLDLIAKVDDSAPAKAAPKSSK